MRASLTSARAADVEQYAFSECSFYACGAAVPSNMSHKRFQKHVMRVVAFLSWCQPHILQRQAPRIMIASTLREMSMGQRSDVVELVEQSLEVQVQNVGKGAQALFA
eukprot:9391269-Alexandrium_andersonii.AAC.1